MPALKAGNAGIRLCYSRKLIASGGLFDLRFLSGYEPVGATLGKQLTNPKFRAARGLTGARFLNNKIFLGFVIGLMVVVLAWGLYRASRRVDQAAEEEKPQ